MHFWIYFFDFHDFYDAYMQQKFLNLKSTGVVRVQWCTEGFFYSKLSCVLTLVKYVQFFLSMSHE